MFVEGDVLWEHRKLYEQNYVQCTVVTLVYLNVQEVTISFGRYLGNTTLADSCVLCSEHLNALLSFQFMVRRGINETTSFKTCCFKIKINSC